MDPTGLSLIEQLASEFLERRRNNENPTIEEYVALAPQFADKIPEVFQAMIAMEEMKARKLASGEASLGPHEPKRMGPYVIRGRIGRGGMGVVYDAVHEKTHDRVAVKVLPQHALADPDRLQRFQREAQVAARLEHPHIVRVLEFGEHDGFHYLVMQHIDGRGLEYWCTPHGDVESTESGGGRSPITPAPGIAGLTNATCPAGERLSYKLVARIGAQVASALQHAHDQGVIHRDIKPSNLLIDQHYQAWVVDFGLAKATSGMPLTRPGQVLGTLRYLPPERLDGEVDVRSDVYGLGVTLYEVLAGTPAIRGRNRIQMIDQIRRGNIAPIRSLDPQVPPALESIILTAISHHPQYRHSTAGEMGAEFERLAK